MLIHLNLLNESSPLIDRQETNPVKPVDWMHSRLSLFGATWSSDWPCRALEENLHHLLDAFHSLRSASWSSDWPYHALEGNVHRLLDAFHYLWSASWPSD